MSIFKYCHPDIYDNTHWHLSFNEKNDFFVCNLKYNDIYYTIKINSTNKRDFRIIVCLSGSSGTLNSIELKTTINREFTIEEKNGLFAIASYLTNLYEKLNLFPQISFAGNKAMKVSKDNFIILCEAEPLMLHLHILGRGITGKEYIKDIEYFAPEIG